MKKLNKILDEALQRNGMDFYKNQVPDYVNANLRRGFKPRPYQQEAFGRFNFFWKDQQNKPKDVPTQLLYHMATGSGKTLVMAGLILYLYEQGYHNFLFFVNSTNLIEKTRDNFLNTFSTKYLFADNLSIRGKQIRIKEVANFQAANQEDINIVFSTVQGLHSRLNTPKENSVTYEDFEGTKIVLLSDEAHHINSETKKKKTLSKSQLEDTQTWEGTVNRILYADKDNILLEFTATADLSNPQLARKYSDKLIFDYPLRQFRRDGYSKEVKVLQADLTRYDRALQAVLLSQYRRKIFEKHQKKIKPVILFKSRTIKESQNFFDIFANGIKNLKVSDLNKIKASEPDEAIAVIFQYLEKNTITLENLINELKHDFSEEKLLSVNSKNESEEKQLAVNSLEDEKNEYRVIFAVDKLNEGWDVLNLFDIVRLYDTRDTKKSKPGKTTMAEAQLIGRGARYCPFKVSGDQEFFNRKFDDDLTNELRICEELYYHSAYNPRYIQELNTALEEIGIKAKRTSSRRMKLKPAFMETAFYKKGLLFLNEKRKTKDEELFGLKQAQMGQTYKIHLKTGYTTSKNAFGKTVKSAVNRSEKEFNLIDFGEHLMRKAINQLDFYRFSNLKVLFPNLKSISEFITSEDYLGKVNLQVSGLPEQVKNLMPREKLEAAISVLENISVDLKSDQVAYKGSKAFNPFLIKDKITDKILNLPLCDDNNQEFGKSMTDPTETDFYLDLKNKDWYVFEDFFGTVEEKLFINFFDKVYGKLKSKFEEIYLVPNQRYFKIYNFDDGRVTEPGFVLFMSHHQPEVNVNYQIFIEPKSEHLLKREKWNEKSLLQLRENHYFEQLWEGKNYIISGMPFKKELMEKPI